MAGPFADRHIVLGVTGSIAAYKACEIASRLIEGGARVTPVLTHAGREFVGPATLEAITGARVILEMFSSEHHAEIEHIALARSADLFLIAPATAHVIAKAAHGLADDWLSTTLLATRAPILFAPAMNTRMYEHPATRANIRTLKERGCLFVGPGAGQLACGETGYGRLAEPAVILEAADLALPRERDLAGRRVLITSGPTHEAIDPVRYLANRSSGKMGRALALEALRRGAQVTVVAGPSPTPLPASAETVPVTTARDMLEAVQARFADTDIFVAAAAVCDYGIDAPAAEKRKREASGIDLHLAPNPDIAGWAGENKQAGQVVLGFAAETERLLEHAAEKLRRKKLDVIVANQVGGAECAFGADHVRAAILTPEHLDTEPVLMPKCDLVTALFNTAAAHLPRPR